MKRLFATLILLAASAVAQFGVSGEVNTPQSGVSGSATQIQGKAVDAPATRGQIPFYNGTKIGWFIDPVVRMNRDCGIVGTGDETAALNTCIANLPNYTGVLQCDKPGMVIHSNGVVVRDKIGITIRAMNSTHSLNNACQLIYTGAAGGTVVDVERTRDSVLFKGFQIYAGAADIGFQTGQTGSGTNIATADTFEDLAVTNNNSRSTFVGFMIGDSTLNNNDEMKFNHVTVASGTRSGTAFACHCTNVFGTTFKDIVLGNLAIGWNWGAYADIDRVNGSNIGILYKLHGGNLQSFHVQNEDLEQVDQILVGTGGNPSFTEEHGRVSLNVPSLGVTGTAGHPAWDVSAAGEKIKINNMVFGPPQNLVGLTLLKGSFAATVDVDFYDPGCITFGIANCLPAPNGLNSATPFQGGTFGNGTPPVWLGRGFIDEKGMVVPGVGMQSTNFGAGLRSDFTPCTRGNICFGEGQIEFTGIHSILNSPTVSYTGTAGSTTRYYAVVACSDTVCVPGSRSTPSPAIGISNTAGTLDGSHYVTVTWTPALGVNKYGILQQNAGVPSQWNLLMSNISCSTNPCTVKITTNSSTYTTAYPADNETGGVILRGAIKLGKSATQVAAVDFTYATVTGLTTVPLSYNHSGTRQTATHLVVDSCTLGTDCRVTLTGAAAFTSSSSYSCVCQDETAVASCRVAQASGSTFAVTGTGTDTIRYFCAGS